MNYLKVFNHYLNVFKVFNHKLPVTCKKQNGNHQMKELDKTFTG